MQGQYVEDIRVRLTPEQRESLDAMAEERSESMSAVVRKALADYHENE